MSTLRKVAVLLLLAAFLAAPWASAGPRTERPRPAETALLSRAWVFLESLWNKTGCHIDPNGLCAPAPTPVPATGKTGCAIDPNGRCITDPALAPVPATADTGCNIDPDGHCRS